MSFRRPLGAPIDVKELEYISALHQTCLPLCRENATVSSIDIVRFLRSRFALKVSHAHGIDIVKTMGGGIISDQVIAHMLEGALDHYDNNSSTNDNDEEDVEAAQKRNALETMRKRLLRAKTEKLKVENEEEDEEDLDLFTSHQDVMDPNHLPERYLDLVQLLGILLIPTIARAGDEHRKSNPKDKEEEEYQDAPQDHNSNEHHNEEVYHDSFQDEHTDEEELEKHEEQEEEKAAKHHDVTFMTAAEQESLRPKPEGILNDVKHMLLGNFEKGVLDRIEMTNDGPVLNTELVTCLLEAWGEHERAKDKELIEEMVQAAGGEGIVFHLDTFVKALTSDLDAWKVGTEDVLSTPHYDVWKYDSYAEKQKLEERQAKTAAAAAAQEEEEENGKMIMVKTNTDTDDLEPYVPIHKKQGVNIDFTIDAHSSTGLMALIWVFFVCTSLLYATLLNQIRGIQGSCESDNYGCQIVKKLWVWFILAVTLSVSGIVIIFPLTLGNTSVVATPKIVAMCTLAAATFTYIPYITIYYYRENHDPDDSTVAKTVHEENYDNLMNLVFAIGNAVILCFMVQLAVTFVGVQRVRQSTKAWVRGLCTASHTRGCWRIKKAATRKINVMLQHAHALHPGGSSAPNNIGLLSTLRGSSGTEETMLNYVLHGEREERCGGLIWTWSMIWSRKLFDTEGIWITTRLIIIQCAQVIFAVVVGYNAWIFVDWAADRCDNARRELDDLDIGNIPDWVYDMIPTRKEIYAAFYPAYVVMWIIMISLWSVYVPSTATIILKYRSGVKPSLKAKLFNKYRLNPDTVYLNIGNALYAMYGSAVLFFLLVALFIFLFIWDFTRGVMFALLAWAIGLAITIAIKMVVVMTCRKKFYSAYYRIKPLKANFALLALECWFIGLGGGILVGRFTQFILAAVYWVGRTDVRFLDEDVNLLGYGFDMVPFNFEKDLLGHEAHRHPYLDRLATMYMMKLKHGAKFCTPAGSCWRQLFVVALMPWMMKYRVFNDDRIAEALELELKRRARAKREKPTLVDNVKEFGEGLAVGLKTGGQGVMEPEELDQLKE